MTFDNSSEEQLVNYKQISLNINCCKEKMEDNIFYIYKLAKKQKGSTELILLYTDEDYDESNMYKNKNESFYNKKYIITFRDDKDEIYEKLSRCSFIRIRKNNLLKEIIRESNSITNDIYINDMKFKTNDFENVKYEQLDKIERKDIQVGLHILSDNNVFNSITINAENIGFGNYTYIQLDDNASYGKIVVDCGIKDPKNIENKNNVIFITHWHQDHAYVLESTKNYFKYAILAPMPYVCTNNKKYSVPFIKILINDLKIKGINVIQQNMSPSTYIRSKKVKTNLSNFFLVDNILLCTYVSNQSTDTNKSGLLVYATKMADEKIYDTYSAKTIELKDEDIKSLLSEFELCRDTKNCIKNIAVFPGDCMYYQVKESLESYNYIIVPHHAGKAGNISKYISRDVEYAIISRDVTSHKADLDTLYFLNNKNIKLYCTASNNNVGHCTKACVTKCLCNVVNPNNLNISNNGNIKINF